MAKSSATVRRERRAIEALKGAADGIGPIELGMSVFLLTRGQFSMLDMVAHTLQEIGAANVSVWTWAIADYEVEAMAALISDRRVTGARLIVDRSAEHRSATTIDAWRERFTPESVRVCKNHAKIARVWNDTWRVLLRGSMNLNFNPRFEQADITEGGTDFDLVAEIEESLPVLPRLCDNAAADAASGLGRVFEAKTLAMFGGVKVWAK